MKKRGDLVMPWGCLYLNNSGDKYITNNMDFILVDGNGIQKKRRADYYKPFGNFVTVNFRIKGKRYSAFFEDLEIIGDFPVVRNYHEKCGKEHKVT